MDGFTLLALVVEAVVALADVEFHEALDGHDLSGLRVRNDLVVEQIVVGDLGWKSVRSGSVGMNCN